MWADGSCLCFCKFVFCMLRNAYYCVMGCVSYCKEKNMAKCQITRWSKTNNNM